MATAYEGYRALDETQQHIRLMTIHPAGLPSNDNSEAIVICTLETVPLQGANPFYALSYVWGSPTPRGSISINGQIIKVRRSLWLFLSTLRDRFCRRIKDVHSTNHDSIRVWADYICIQQDDNLERNSQVAMMGDIYKAADAIYAWLGEPETPPDDGMRCVAEVAALRARHLPWIRIRRQVDNFDKGIQRISASSYWNRMWIKQEALLAKDLWFFYGQGVANWQDVLFAAKLCPKTSTDGQSQASLSRAMLSLLETRDGQLEQSELWRLVQKFADAECQDPRDRIYALLALIDQQTSQQIVVDYQKPVLQVLLETYILWTNIESRTPMKGACVHQIGNFCANINKILPSADLEALHNSITARKDFTTEGIFCATDVSFLEWVRPIATIGRMAVDPVSCVHETENEDKAFVLRVSLRPYRSGNEPRSRQCFMYTDAVPCPGSLAVWLRGRVLFFQPSTNLTEDKVEGERSRRPFGMGTEIRESSLTTDGDDRLSRQLLRHPCQWLDDQLVDARFAIHSSVIERRWEIVRITCNAAAIILLLHEHKRDQKGSVQGNYGGDASATMGGDQPRLWSPYIFGIEHKLLQPCKGCKLYGRSAGLLTQPTRFAEELSSCECEWVSRTEC